MRPVKTIQTRNVRLLTSMITAFAMVLVALMLSACGSSEASMQAEAEIETPEAVPVEAASVAVGQVEATYGATAVLSAVDETDVRSRTPGEIAEIMVEEGDRVREGQVLARIDAPRLALELKRAEAELAKTQRDLQRQQALLDAGLTSPDAYDQVRYAYRQQQTAFEMAELELSRATIEAPFDGIVASRYVKRGNTVEPETALFRIVDLSRLEASFQIPQHERDRVRVGQTVRMQLDALPEHVFEAEVARISPVVDARTGTYSVTVSADSVAAPLRPGMFARLDVVYETHPQALLIPEAALLTEDKRHSVFVIDDEGRAQRRTVETGIRDGGRIEILSGLEPGERIVVLGQSGLREGTLVAAVDEAETPSV